MRSYLLLLLLSAVLAAGCSVTAASPAATATATLDPQAALGRRVFTRECSRCHSSNADTVIVGPSLSGVATRAETRVPGQDARTYLMTSILRPGDHVVDGFENLMPENLGKKLTGEEIDAVVAYLMTLE